MNRDNVVGSGVALFASPTLGADESVPLLCGFLLFATLGIAIFYLTIRNLMLKQQIYELKAEITRINESANR